ncbi:MAG: hypothetical protein COA79_15500 [Planctomycetota bacterium]|nr:MAG: hypothetical protein COA79_15500 [Planctomycetota bacterium]
MPYFLKVFFLFSILSALVSAKLCAGWSDAKVKKKSPVVSPKIVNSIKKIDIVSTSCLNFFKITKDIEATKIGDCFKGAGLSVQDIKDTLVYVNSIQEEDRVFIKSGKKFSDGRPWEYRLSMFWFLKSHFDIYKISGNKRSAKRKNVQLPEGKMKITKYAFFEIPISRNYSKSNNTAIYALPEWINPKTGKKKYRLRYTKQDIYNGVYGKWGRAKGKAKALGYATRKNFENVMLQGTFVGRFSNGTRQIFGPSGTNEIPFNSRIKVSKQKRYIYYSIKDGFYGYGKTKEDKIKVQTGVTFAGNVKQFGIGKLLLMTYKDPKLGIPKARLGIIADTGSAFVDNNFQLDFLLGAYSSKKGFYSAANQIPEYCEIFLLIKRKK